MERIYTAMLNILQATIRASLDKAVGLVLLDNIAFRSSPSTKISNNSNNVFYVSENQIFRHDNTVPLFVFFMTLKFPFSYFLFISLFCFVFIYYIAVPCF